MERPEKIICVGLNYRDHAEEQGVALPERPLLFAKWPNTLIGDGEPIRLPSITQKVDYEAELGVVIDRRAHQVAVADALDVVRGYVVANDVSAATSSSRTASGYAASRSTRFFPSASSCLRLRCPTRKRC